MVRLVILLLVSTTAIFSVGVVGFSIRALAELEFATSTIGSRELVTAASVMLAVGAFALVTTPLGLLSAMATYSPITLTYAILMFFICLLSIVGCCFGFRLRNEIDSGVILEWMNYSLQTEYGNPFANDLTLSWDQLHVKYACCGITDQSSPTDWLNSYWFITYDRWPRPRVPPSCCSTCETKGCYKPLLRDLHYYSKGTILVSSIMAFLCLLNVFLCFFTHKFSFDNRIHGESLIP